MLERMPSLDQATGLRRMLRRPAVRVLPILGPHGAPWLVAALARVLSGAGERVLVIDQAGEVIARELRIARPLALDDFLDGVRFVGPSPFGAEEIRVLAASRGLERLGGQGIPMEQFFAALASLAEGDEPCDLVIIHLTEPRAIARIVDPDAEILMATGVSESWIERTYRAIKAATPEHRQFKVLINGANDLSAAMRTYRRIARTAEKFLGLVPAYGGFLPAESFAMQGQGSPSSSAQMRAVARLAAGLGDWPLAEYPAGFAASAHSS